jgi:hypothetical protein
MYVNEGLRIFLAAAVIAGKVRDRQRADRTAIVAFCNTFTLSVIVANEIHLANKQSRRIRPVTAHAT